MISSVMCETEILFYDSRVWFHNCYFKTQCRIVDYLVL